MLKLIFVIVTVVYVVGASVGIAHINPIVESFPLFLFSATVIVLPAALFWTDRLHQYGRQQIQIQN
jgi:hypothetical protein